LFKPLTIDVIKGVLNPNLRKKYKTGDIVVIAEKGGWQPDTRGIVIGGPETVWTRQGADYYYWVEFSIPAYDLSDDGPYEKAQILSRFIDTAR